LRVASVFLADLLDAHGTPITAHCPNTGKMRGVLIPGTAALYSISDAPNRTYPHTLESILCPAQTQGKSVWVGINTQWPNRLITQALTRRQLHPFEEYTEVKPEVSLAQGIRVDGVLNGPGLPTCYIEIKNVHYAEEGVALFPDTPTARGLKHVHHLTQIKQQQPQVRAALIYVVQRDDCHAFRPAAQFDPAYAHAAHQAHASGVKQYVYQCTLSETAISLAPLSLDTPC
jgi:sugar fermentation stimulation protein A